MPPSNGSAPAVGTSHTPSSHASSSHSSSSRASSPQSSSSRASSPQSRGSGVAASCAPFAEALCAPPALFAFPEDREAPTPSPEPRAAPSSIPWQRRAFSPIERGSVRGSIFTLASSCLGAGVLATPYAMQECGLAVGLALLCLHAFVSFFTTYILLTSSKLFRTSTYADLAHRAVPALPRSLVDMIIVLNGLGVCLSFLVFLGDFLPASLESLGLLPHATDYRGLLLCASMVVIVPLSIQPRLSALRHFAFFPVCALLFSLSCVVYRAGSLMQEQTNPVVLVSWNWNFFKSFNVFLFAFMQHVNVCPIGRELQNPSDPRVYKVSLRAAALEWCLYAPIATIGYLSFRGNSKQNFMMNYRTDDRLMHVCTFLLSFSMILGVPLTVIPTVESLFNLMALPAAAPPASSAAAAAGLSARPGMSAPLLLHADRSDGAFVIVARDRGDACVDQAEEKEEDARRGCDIVAASEAPGGGCGLAPVDEEAAHDPERRDVDPAGRDALGAEEEAAARGGGRVTAGAAGGGLAGVAQSVLRNRKICACACLYPVLLMALVTDKAADVVGLLGGFFSTLLMCGLELCGSRSTGRRAWAEVCEEIPSEASALPSIIFFRGIGKLYYKPATRTAIFVFLLAVTCVGALSSVLIILQNFGVCCRPPESPFN
ncbi:transmembrane amino acid transporter protein [Besnoitia besnoiti]|uniref:Transmembrane amino acid transporter protein n=1 Tax=Besnoitia besnoiti TaxID=94643 RepID=A0A2A9MFX1_BESBE|nr:transmembrane amino acid transporter protein [Besnoitia besnoiti]PFH35161.1 transmembrane amino acid transporter protein [Besnoitia besnoiti]